MAQLKVSGSRMSERPARRVRALGAVGVGEERDDVEEREGQDGEQRSAGEPLQLLALQGLLFAAIAEPEDGRGDDVEDGEVGESIWSRRC